MASYNRIILVGNVTRDPQLSFLPSQTAVCEFGLAINKKWKDAQGNAKESVCFVDCKVFSKRAEVVNQYVHKGDPLMVEGELAFNQWEDKQGNKRSKHYVNVSNFVFLKGRGEGEGQQPQRPQQAEPAEDSTADHVCAGDIPF